MQTKHSFLVFALLSLSVTQQRSSSSSTRSRARSLTVSRQPSGNGESLSPALSTIPPNEAPKIIAPPSVPGNDIQPLTGNAEVRDVIAEKDNVERQAKTTPISMPSRVPADLLLPREIEDGNSQRKPARDLDIVEQSANPIYLRQATSSSNAPKKSKKPKKSKTAKKGGAKGGAGCSKGNGTANAVPESKAPESKAAKTTGGADLANAAAFRIPNDAPTIPFPTNGASLPLIPTPKGGKPGLAFGSGRLTTTSASSALPTL